MPACRIRAPLVRGVSPWGLNVPHRCFAILGVVCCFASGGRAAAQAVQDQAAPPAVQQAPASISVVEGAATLERDGRAEPAVVSMPLVGGDRLRTDSGRVEVAFPDGSVLHLDRSTTADFLSLSLVRLLEGRAIFVVAGAGRDRPSLDYQVDAPGGSIQIVRPGEYRISLFSGPGSQPTVALHVVTGGANLFNDHGTVDVQAGERSEANEDRSPSPPLTFNSARWDAFERWSQDRRQDRTGSTSTRYLPSDLQPYSGTFDRYGRWDHDPEYGSVWYPTVAADWRPYYSGYWNDVGPYGWTWIGYDPWTWPTHHYGRWGWRHDAWCWIPGLHWASAWVSWALAPGYVSWSPLGFNNGPVFGFWPGAGSSYRGYVHDPWNAWTVVPRHAFGTRTHMSAVAVRGSTLPARERAGFAMHRTLPIAGPTGTSRVTAVASGAQPPVGRAMPRNGTSGTARPLGAETPGATGVAARRAAPGSVPGADRATRAGVPDGGGVMPAGSPLQRRPDAAAQQIRAVPRGNTAATGSDGRRLPSPNAPVTARPPAFVRRAPSTAFEDRPSYATPRGTGVPFTGRPEARSPAGSVYQPRSRDAAPGVNSSRPSYSPPAGPRVPDRTPSRNYTPAPTYSPPRASAPSAYPRSSPPSYSRSAPPSYSRSVPPSYSRSAPPSYSRSAPSMPPRSAPPSRSGGGGQTGGQARPRR